MTVSVFRVAVPCWLMVTPAILSRAPIRGLAQDGIAAAKGGFDPRRIGGTAAQRGSGAQRPDRRVVYNSIVGPYCVTFNEGRR